MMLGKSVGSLLSRGKYADDGAAAPTAPDASFAGFAVFGAAGVSVSAASGAAISTAPENTPSANERATGPRTDVPSRTRATRRASEFFDGATPCAPRSKPGHSWRATPTSNWA